MTTDAWNPSQYDRFAAERRQPFDDLLALVEPVPGGRAIDLGCGTGALTVEMHRGLGIATTVGVDLSPAMLAGAPHADGVCFEEGDLAAYVSATPVDVVFSNAALQWVGDHGPLLARLAGQLAPGGQLAVQMPCNADHPSHTVAAEVAVEFFATPPEDPVAGNVLAPYRYAAMLYDLGFAQQHVRVQVYGHVLDSTADVVEWTKGTTLTRFRALMADDQFSAFVDRYRARLLEVLGDRSPFFYPFKRILFWARTPA